ncbi:MAG: hypothetical protein CMK09_05200 [Ponticaulis sp.]|nr:hypothetical protein [Ponticaulis sp.]|tara:strand:+ start:14813 stop:15097 length:285 start_codon:yes stop_codon:yes gene_type:complete
MKTTLGALLFGAALIASPAFAGDAKYSTKTTTIGELLDNEATLAVFEEHLPDVVNHPQVEMGRMMTLVEAQSYEPGIITNEALAAMDEDLAEIE